jgi:hypothetical protein
MPQTSPMSPRLRAHLLWSGATIVVAAISVLATVTFYQWSPVAPKDYEECAERAARDGKSKDALSVLVSVCRSKFAGRRKMGGGYIYYDPCQAGTFDINGPNPTTDEVKHIRDQCLAYLSLKSQMEAEQEEAKSNARLTALEAKAAAQQAEREERAKAQQAEQAASAAMQARKLAAISSVRVTKSNFETCEYGYCHWQVEVTNGSKEALSIVVIGLSSISTVGTACPSSYATRETLKIGLSPGERRGATIDLVDIEFSKHPLCTKVLDVEYAGR